MDNPTYNNSLDLLVDDLLVLADVADWASYTKSAALHLLNGDILSDAAEEILELRQMMVTLSNALGRLVYTNDEPYMSKARQLGNRVLDEYEQFWADRIVPLEDEIGV